ncbi:MAG: RagB/SusD family nutrient uptake outer membrane protein, partial [Candidatus Cryptobacteroides sp.]
WSYYNVYELWGGALPLNVTATAESSDIPGSADADFDKGCKIIWDFIATELDECCGTLPVNSVNRMNQAANRIIKARLLLNAEVFIGENRYSECATLCQELIDGKYGSYDIAKDWRDIYSIHNNECPEVVMAFSYDTANLNPGWMRVMPFVAYNVWEYMGGTYTQSGWNCCCIAPSYDNSGDIQPNGGTIGAKCFLDSPYNDKLGAVYERFSDKDARKKPFHANADGTYEGIFLLGEQKSYDGSQTLAADADRQDMPLVYVDQVGTFLNLGKNLETVMSPRWGETNSGYRLVRYPIFPESAGIDFQDIDEVEIRFAEVYYMLAECKLRANQVEEAKNLVKYVKGRYFASADDALELPMGFTAYDEDWMLHEWGIEFLCEGRRRRTDLRRFDKFTQGVWWFFGDRAKDDTYSYPAKRDRKYEWYPLPETALKVNPGLVQNPDYR